jgi:hypothetical protein
MIFTPLLSGKILITKVLSRCSLLRRREERGVI